MEKIYELKVTILLKEDLKLNDSYGEIGRFINYSMNKSDSLAELHKRGRTFKHYCFSSFYPCELDKIYKKENYYTFLIRSSKGNIINALKESLDGLENDIIETMDIENVEYKKSNIDYIDTLTPVIVTKDNRSWNILKDDKAFFDKAIINNLVKKFNELENISIETNYNDIVDRITIKNKYAIIVNYKGIKMLGYKVRIYFKNNIIAQEIANITLCDGVGEKNSSCGQGFCKPYFTK